MKKGESDKGLLVKGYIPPISKDFIGFSIFRRELGKMLKYNSGAYVLYNNDKLYYVGITQDLFKRLDTHTKDKHKGKWNKFSVFIIRKNRYLKDIESMIHRISEPKANIAKGKFKEHFQYDIKIKQMVREVLRIIKKIQRS
jgi:predicted GIY-YIG superfamily endonuclease